MFFACGSLVIYFLVGAPKKPINKNIHIIPKRSGFLLRKAGPSPSDPPAAVVGTALRQAGLEITAENVLRALKAVKPGEEPSSKDLKIDGEIPPGKPRVGCIHLFFFAVHLRKMCLKFKNGS